MSSCLAMFGGSPVRTKAFHSSVNIDDEERRLVLEVLEKREFSRFMGSPTLDIDKLLIMPSKEAVDYQSQYFNFLGGRMVRRFERDFADFFGKRYAISVNSATSGLSTALGAVGIGPGDEVITTCLSFNATALSILLFNSIPVFVDISRENSCLDPKKVREAITDKTKAILVVHLLGFPADMDEILEIANEHKLKVIEDCAQAPGTKYKGKFVGTIGDVGIFSFQETKNIMTGEGGMIITDDPEVAKRCRLIRNHGESIPDINWCEEDLVNLIGMNFRMNELTASIGIAQLKKLRYNNEIRVINASHFLNGVKGIEGIEIVPFPEDSVPHVVPLIYDEDSVGVPRDDILRAIRAEGIPVAGGYQNLMSENAIFQKKIAYGLNHCPWSCRFYGRDMEYTTQSFPIAKEMINKKFIWFYHIHPPNTISDMEDAIAAFRKVFSNLDELRGADLKKQELGYKW